MAEGEKEEEEKKELMKIIIPEELCSLEILPRLPGKEVLVLKAVCKDWATLIGSPYFGRLHLSLVNSYYQNPRIRLVSVRGIHDYDTAGDTELIIPYPPSISKLHLPPIIVGSVHGLLCLLQEYYRVNEKKLEHYEITVCNPSTRRFFSVRPTPSLQVIRCWFGNITGEYVLVVLQSPLNRIYIEIVVYKFTTTNLKRTQYMSVDLRDPIGHLVISDAYNDYRGVFMQGAVHWPIQWVNYDRIARTNFEYYFKYTIMAYHLESNTHVQFSPPVQYCDLRLGAMDGCLCATLKRRGSDVFELWMRKERGWTKRANIQGSFGIGFGRLLLPLGFFPNTGDLLLGDYNVLIKYNLYHNRPTPTILNKYVCFFNQGILCADTLVSPSVCRV